MDENGKGPGNDEQKGIVEWNEISGVFSVNRVRDLVDQQRDELAQDAYKAMAYQELCAHRAEVRNDFRTWAERVPFLASTFGVDPIPAMTPRQIAEEEQHRVDRKAERIARRHKNDMLMQAVHNYVQTAASPLRDSTQIELEEKAKYLAGKLRKLFLRQDFAGAVKFFHEHTEDFPYPHEAEVFADLVYEECRIFLRMISEQALYHLLPDALEAIAQMTKLEREDFYFMRENLQSDEEKKVFEDKLCDAMMQHPAIYIRMRQTFIDLGFIDGPRIDAQPKIQEAIKSMLVKKVDDPEIYFSYLHQLHRAGVVQGDDIHQSSEIQDALEKALEKAMKVGPVAYILLRNRMSEHLFIDSVGFNYNEKIQEASVEHFENWYGVESESFATFLAFLRRHGVVVPKSFEEKLGGKTKWYKKLWHKIRDELIDVDGDYFEDFMVQSSGFDEHFLQEERSKIAATLRVFSEKYPMYRRGK